MSQELHKIGGYIGFQKGKPPKTTFENQENGMLPYLSPEYLRGLDDPLYVEPNERLITIDDDELIVLWDGSNAGEIFLSKKGVLASTMTKLIVDHSAFGHRYFTFSMKYLEYLLKAKTAGSGIPHVDKGIVKNLEIAKPPLPEQRAIASVLSKVDDAIAATKNTIAKAEQLKKALMQNLLTGRLKPDGTRRTDDEFYIDEKFGKVPKGWEVKKVKDCFEFFPTSSYSRSKLTDQGECMYVHYGDIHTKFYCFIDVQYSQLPFITFEMGEKYTKVKEGDLIMADASEDYDGVGKCVEVKNINNAEIICGLHTLHLRDKSDLFVNGYKENIKENILKLI